MEGSALVSKKKRLRRLRVRSVPFSIWVFLGTLGGAGIVFSLFFAMASTNQPFSVPGPMILLWFACFLVWLCTRPNYAVEEGAGQYRGLAKLRARRTEMTEEEWQEYRKRRKERSERKRRAPLWMRPNMTKRGRIVALEDE